MSGTADTTYAIHPALGIARMGDCAVDMADPDSYYLGPDVPGEVPNAGKDYKLDGRIKKQAQRFRIYEYVGGEATREISLDCADVQSIEWTVTLANRKAALDVSEGTPPGSISKPEVIPPVPWGLADVHITIPKAELPYWPAQTRNPEVAEADRETLCIQPGPASVTATAGGTDGAAVMTGNITLPPVEQGSDGAVTAGTPGTKAVTLGTLRLEADTGRLLVFAGDGLSEGVLMDGTFSQLASLLEFGGNNGWYDCSADGAVEATVTFSDGTRVSLTRPEQRAWVICASPRFVPAMNWISSLYDVAETALFAPEAPEDLENDPSFKDHIYPILRCAAQLPAVAVKASSGHSKPPGAYFTPQVLGPLASADPSNAAVRKGVFDRMRNPYVLVQPDERKEDYIQRSMPQLSPNVYETSDDRLQRQYELGVITQLQYARMMRWRDGKFEADFSVPADMWAAPAPLDEAPVADRPSLLDRGAVDGTCGTPFYPGIESWRITRTADLYADSTPLRMAASTQPGDLTMGNALPWQADYLDCDDLWWPVQRPNDVTRDGQNFQAWVPAKWVESEGAESPEDNGYNKMVRYWARLGFVISEDDGETFHEVERSKNVPE